MVPRRQSDVLAYYSRRAADFCSRFYDGSLEMNNREHVHVVYMDDKGERFSVGSTTVIQNVLNLYDVIDFNGKHLPDRHVPISNIRYWTKEETGE